LIVGIPERHGHNQGHAQSRHQCYPHCRSRRLLPSITDADATKGRDGDPYQPGISSNTVNDGDDTVTDN